MKVKDIIKIIESDGGYLITIRGSHRQYKHPTKKGQVTVSGHLAKDMPIGLVKSVFKQAQLEKG